MKKTISTINARLFLYRLGLFWCYMRFALLCIYILFIFFSPFAIGICIQNIDNKLMSFLFGWIKWLCVPMFFYNLGTFEKNSFISEKHREITSNQNQLRDAIYKGSQLKKLIKKAIAGKLEYSEFRYRLNDIFSDDDILSIIDMDEIDELNDIISAVLLKRFINR